MFRGHPSPFDAQSSLSRHPRCSGGPPFSQGAPLSQCLARSHTCTSHTQGVCLNERCVHQQRNWRSKYWIKPITDIRCFAPWNAQRYFLWPCYFFSKLPLERSSGVPSGTRQLYPAIPWFRGVTDTLPFLGGEGMSNVGREVVKGWF